MEFVAMNNKREYILLNNCLIVKIIFLISAVDLIIKEEKQQLVNHGSLFTVC